jgi:hypothetical protein
MKHRSRNASHGHYRAHPFGDPAQMARDRERGLADIRGRCRDAREAALRRSLPASSSPRCRGWSARPRSFSLTAFG